MPEISARYITLTFFVKKAGDCPYLKECSDIGIVDIYVITRYGDSKPALTVPNGLMGNLQQERC
jgi:hypothetical protein